MTISREPGAGGRTFGERLVDRLNETLAADEPHRWTLWDRELVEKVAADHHLARELVESIGRESRSWLIELFNGLSFGEATDEARVYRRVAETIRALAGAGRVVIVGRGGVFITRNMPGGIHLRLVAPLGYRIEQVSQLDNLSLRDAAARIRELEGNRNAFLRRYWPKEIIQPLAFTMTLNTCTVSADEIAGMVQTLICARILSSVNS